jgi:cardiolipin synthase
VIDDAVAFAGSHNVIDPSYGGRRGNPWIDLSARLTGPVACELAAIFCEDWAFETGEMLSPCHPPENASGGIPMQVVPTGPISPGETYRRLLLGAIQCARSRLTLTTPYFVPDDPTVVDLLMAADQGVQVKLILPLHGDNRLIAAVARAQFERLMEAGIEIYQYGPGLIHAKTTTVDDAFCLFGSANLDVRSFNLNFELSILMYGAEVTEQVRAIQSAYLKDSKKVDLTEWKKRSALRRYTDGAVSLVSPLL